MYIDVGTKKVGDKVYPRYLIRESYWENGRSRQRTIANISDCPLEDINAMRLALKYKGNISDIIIDSGEIHTEQGLSVGAVFSLYKVAQELGIVKALGNTEKAKRALWMILARLIEPGSRMANVRLAQRHSAVDILNMNDFNEDVQKFDPSLTVFPHLLHVFSFTEGSSMPGLNFLSPVVWKNPWDMVMPDLFLSSWMRMISSSMVLSKRALLS